MHLSNVLFVLTSLVVSSAILNNVLKARLTGHLPKSSIVQLTSSVYALSSLDLTPEQHQRVLDAYMKGMHTIFIMYAPVVGACFVAASLVKDRGVAEKDASAVGLREKVCDGTNVVNEGPATDAPHMRQALIGR